jgi:MoaA/NifB/PqqE/SkfB family radical SAM enzyme
MYKIKAIQIDVNGLCNAGCWFCPVSYAKNPEQAIRDMPLHELENIFIQLRQGENDFVEPGISVIYSANYNEILLYKDLKGMLDLYRKYNFKTYILTNGVALTKNKVDILSDYQDVIDGILLNIPASDAESWSKYVGMNKKLFPKLVDNVRYAINNLTDLIDREAIHLGVNGLKEESLTENGGWVDKLPGSPDINLDNNSGDLVMHTERLKKIFPEIIIYQAFHLYDRAAHLEKYNIMTQAPAIEKYLKKDGLKVIGCNGGIINRSRTNEWIHINPNGDLFICCADYDFETIYGNINQTSLKDIWMGKEREDMVESAYSNMCTKCSAAIWG